MSHTPAPWKVRYDKHGYNVPKSVVGKTGKAILQFTWTMVRNLGIEERRANASLIATAPELLAFIQKQRFELLQAGWTKWVRELDVLVAKATGSDL